jgi:hypothetical protein
MSTGLRYIGTMDTGKSNLNSRAEFKIDKGGKAFLQFDQGAVSSGKLGIKDFKAHDNLSASLCYQPSTKKGNLELLADVGHDTTVTVPVSYPLPTDVMQVPVKIVSKKNIIKNVDSKITAKPLQKAVEVQLSKCLKSTKHFDKASLLIDHPADTISLRLQSKSYNWQDIDHDLRLTMMTPFGNSTQAAKNSLLYTGKVNSDLSVSAEMCQPQAKGNLAKLKAVYKMGDVEATATCDLTSEKKLENANLILKTTLDL